MTPPGNNRPWASYTLKSCVKGTTTCQTITCPAHADANGLTHCPIPNCTPATSYTVTAVAVKTGLTSPESEPDDFTTDSYP